MSQWRLLLRDIATIGLGGWLAVHEALSSRPSGAVLLLAMGLLVPSSAHYVKALLSEPGDGESSEPQPESASSSPSPPAGGSGD